MSSNDFVTQVGTHADSQIAEAVIKGVQGFDLDLAYEAVHKDATVPPVNDQNTSFVAYHVTYSYMILILISTCPRYFDREEVC